MTKGEAMDLKTIQEKIKAANIDSLRIDFVDLHGVCRSKLAPARRLEALLEEGLHHAQATYALDLSNNVAMGTGCGDEVEWRDMVVKPDLSTFAILPHMTATARLIGNSHREDGSPHPVDPRNVLMRVVKRYEDKGWRPVSASELEFFLFTKEAGGATQYYNPGLSCVYQVNPIIDRQGILRLLQNTFLDLGLEIIYLNSEFFPGQFEVNWKYDHALVMADQTFTFKYVCKEIAAMNNLLLTFMGRPRNEGGGSGYHVHLSVSDLKTRKNLFDDPDGVEGMSQMMRHFLGGQMAHAKEMAALLAPTVNSYKRYVPDSFAPYYLAWGRDNRTVYCRIPDERGPATRVENRLPCAAANPYLVMAALFAAGLDGIENKIDPGEPATGDIYGAAPETYPTVTQYFRDALNDLKGSSWLREALGPEVIHAFVALKEHELARYRTYVSDWEFSEYSYHL